MQAIVCKSEVLNDLPVWWRRLPFMKLQLVQLDSVKFSHCKSSVRTDTYDSSLAYIELVKVWELGFYIYFKRLCKFLWIVMYSTNFGRWINLSVKWINLTEFVREIIIFIVCVLCVCKEDTLRKSWAYYFIHCSTIHMEDAWVIWTR